ncbi:MAG: hypothetical protein ACFE85_17270 [Candidatus Hodarchaeota archaeon]
MKNLDPDIEVSNYYRVICPSDIKISREDIFYRDKFNDIINYLKIMLTNQDDSVIQQYLQTKGKLLINISSGTDIIDFLKLISKNYYLEFLELDYENILKDQDYFYNNFNNILKSIIKEEKIVSDDKENGEKKDDSIRNEKISRILLINEHELSTKTFEEKKLLKTFLISHKNSENNISYVNKGLILVWINNNLDEIKENSREIFQIFDLFVKVPILSKIERETILRNFSEKNPKIVFNINKIVELTNNWEVKDIAQLLKVAIFKHFLNSELNETSNEITDNIIDLIESGEYIPSIPFRESNVDNNIPKNSESQRSMEYYSKVNQDTSLRDNSIEKIISHIQNEPISDFMLNQLYENAVSKNYTELLIILDKIDNKEILEDIDRKIIAKYPFILNENPSKARINLEKAKKRIDNIKRAFEKRYPRG